MVPLHAVVVKFGHCSLMSWYVFVFFQEGKTRATPWGSTYRAPPEILHGGWVVKCAGMGGVGGRCAVVYMCH